MASQEECVSLYEKVWVKPSLWKRVSDIVIMLLLLLLLAYRLMSIDDYAFPWFVAFACELWFAISWFLAICSRWTPCVIKTYPQRLFQRVTELPAIDVFVTTADPVMEPPILTINTVLSLLALEYPSHKLACYVSDDGCSPLTLHALREACKFAKLWVPFCKKYNVEVRAPFRYFSDDHKGLNSEESPEFKKEWVIMKDEYERLKQRIEAGPDLLDEEFADFSNTERRNHPSIIKVIWENKESGEDGLPHLVYISREKRPKHPHHYKAGAMNVLTRVSGLMTNAPFILNVDCDMFVNNPQVALHAMCILLDPIGQKEVAFAQCFQQFYGGLKDDPYGNQMVVLFTYMATGVSGIQGLFYSGTNCFHRRKVIYGLSPYDMENGDRSEEALVQKFGLSKELVKSVSHALEGKTYSPNANISNSLKAAIQVASCGHEHGNGWGKKVGWIYGSKTEDVLTGLTIHKKGWRSETCTPDPIPFTGCAPEGGPASLTQQKRWVIGLLEIFFSKHCPIFGPIFGNLQVRQSLAYLWVINWGFRGVLEICYALLPVYCIITNSTFFPKGQGIWIHVALFVIYNIHTVSEYLVTGLSMRAWWNNQRMSRIIAMNAWLFGLLSIILKFLGISDTVFEITEKQQSSSSGDDEDASRFTFNDSPMFIPGTTILLLYLTAMAIKLLGLQPSTAQSGNYGSGLGELFCVSYMILCYWPFLKGLFLNEKYGLPWSIVCKSAALAFLFVLFSRSTIVDETSLTSIESA